MNLVALDPCDKMVFCCQEIQLGVVALIVGQHEVVSKIGEVA
jgi:hypothetical protein